MYQHFCDRQRAYPGRKPGGPEAWTGTMWYLDECAEKPVAVHFKLSWYHIGTEVEKKFLDWYQLRVLINWWYLAIMIHEHQLHRSLELLLYIISTKIHPTLCIGAHIARLVARQRTLPFVCRPVLR